MKKVLFVLAAVLALAGSAFAQFPAVPTPAVLAPYTVSTLPSATAFQGLRVQVTDGATASDCTVGGGSTKVVCVAKGSAWVYVVAPFEIRGTATLTFTSITTLACQTKNFALTGVTTSNFGVKAGPLASLGNAGYVWSAYVSANNNIIVNLCNMTTGTLTPSAVVWGASVTQQ